ncbi:hypothetical protein [Martelella alba]|nr:hypothetical protein [Martelella alba]
MKHQIRTFAVATRTADDMREALVTGLLAGFCLGLGAVGMLAYLFIV